MASTPILDSMETAQATHLFDHGLDESVGRLNVLRIGALQEPPQQRRLLAVLEDGVRRTAARWQGRRRRPVGVQLTAGSEGWDYLWVDRIDFATINTTYGK